MNNLFSFPDLSDNLTKKKMHSCGTVRPNRKGMSWDLGWKNLRLKWGDIRLSTRSGIHSTDMDGQRDMHMLTNTHNPSAEGNFSNNNGNALKPAIVEDYNRHMGYVEKGDRMANTLLAATIGNEQKKTYFHLLDLTILNSYILFSSCGEKISRREFCPCLIRDM
jgi:hypothetical protein